MTKKFYAVKRGRKTGIFLSWSETQDQINGFQNSSFKSFSSSSAAQQWLDNTENGESINTNDLIAYVDGSKLNNIEGYGSGVVILDSKGSLVYKKSFKGDQKKYLDSKQIAGETNATLHAVGWAIANKYNSILIKYDYIGIENWATGSWKANKKVAIDYKNKINELKEKIKIEFSKVKAHSNNKFNDMADMLAKSALEDDKHTENSNGSHSLKGIENEDLQALIKIINEDKKLRVESFEDSDDNSENKIIYKFYDKDNNCATVTYFKKICYV